MATRILNKAIIALSAVLTLGLSGCSGCSPHTWSNESSMSSINPENTYEIKWMNYGNRLLYKETVHEGATPVYHGATPTRTPTTKYTYTFSGWSPDIVPAFEDATYTAQYTTEYNKFTVAFVAGNCTCEYSQDLIADVPFGTKVEIDGSSITINGTTVTVRATPTEGESILHNYSFERWSVSEGYEIKGDTTISAVFSATDKLYNLTVSAVGGGILKYDNTYESNYEFEFINGKSYHSIVEGGEQGQPVADHLYLTTYIDGYTRSFGFIGQSPDDDFYIYVLDGWYFNGRPLLYGEDLTGDIMIEARFHKEQKDFTYVFDFEINTATNDAAIIGVKEEYDGDYFKHLTIPRSYEGYPVAGIKNAALSHIRVDNLAIPNTLIYIEEIEDVDCSARPEYFVIQKIALEDGSTNFRLIDGVLYNYAMTEAITGTNEMIDYFNDGVFEMPNTVTYIWKAAFKNISMKSVVLPNNITTISSDAFANTRMETTTLPNSVTTIEFRAFDSCRFEEVIIPDSVIEIQYYAFENNQNLKRVHFGAGLKLYNYNAFWYCLNIESFTVSEDNEYFAVYNDALYDKALTYLYSAPKSWGAEDPINYLATTLEEIAYNSFTHFEFETLHLPEGVKKIQNMAIVYCPNLVSIYLPSTIKYLGGDCFEGCSNVTYMEYNGTVEQFGAIEKAYSWNPWNKSLTNLTEIVCTDGVFSLND